MSKSQMTKKESIDLMAYFTLISVSKQGENLVGKLMTREQIDKMMQVAVILFDNNSKKAENFIINNLNRLLKKLETHEISESQKKKFEKKGDVEG